MKYHKYHLVDNSPWPLVLSIGTLILTGGLVMYMHRYIFGGTTLLIGLSIVILTATLWWKDIIREGTFEGDHTKIVQKGLKIGMILFIISEVFFFIAFFWAFFHSSLSPSVEIGAIWPPKGIEAINPWEVPFVNTIILLSSGATVTWAHHGIRSGNRKDGIIGLFLTIALGIIFTSLQIMEYYESGFTIAEGIYGSTFYGATGLHGFHVMIGTIFLGVSLYRMLKYHYTRNHHFGFEAAAWYWHFVDVVWIFLYISIYYWGY